MWHGIRRLTGSWVGAGKSVVEYYSFQIIIVVGVRGPRLLEFSSILHRKIRGCGRNPQFYLVKVGGPRLSLCCCDLGLRSKTGATARDVSKFLEKTSSETSTFTNHITTSRHFRVFFLFRGLRERPESPRCLYFPYNP